MVSFARSTQIFFAALSALTLLGSNALAVDFHDLVKTKLVITKVPGLEIHGVRFGSADHAIDPKKPALIFTHGLESNYHEFESLIPKFVEQGYDCYAYNFRGHGNGTERSTVEPYSEGDYKFEHLADVDLPLMIEQIQSLHPGAVKLIGHSMGGMVPRAAFHRGSISPREISSMILIGSPAHFKTSASKSDPLFMQWHLRNYLFLGSGKEPLLNMEHARTAMRLTNFLGPLAWAGNYLIASSMKAIMAKELGPLAHTPDRQNWSKRAMSDLTPKDIFRSFADFQIEYPYDSVAIPVPILHIVGDKDTLAPANDIIESASVQSEKAGYWAIRVKQIGHFGNRGALGDGRVYGISAEVLEVTAPVR